MIHTMQFLV